MNIVSSIERFHIQSIQFQSTQDRKKCNFWVLTWVKLSELTKLMNIDKHLRKTFTNLCISQHIHSVGGDDFDDVEDDDNIDDLNQEEEAENFEIIAPGQQGGGVPKNKRITTRYMTK